MPPWRSAGLFFAVVLLAACCNCVSGGYVVKNVTVSGVSATWSSGALPDGWRATSVALVNVKNFTGVCPAGRYCPGNTTDPIMCTLGMYTMETKRVTNCDIQCALDYYCPDPGKRIKCPDNTQSKRGAMTQLNCTCKAGYQCVYKKVLLANVKLNIPYRVWISPEGEALRQALLEAVAAVAKVPLGSVSINKVLPGIVNGGSGGGRRRMLSLGSGERQANEDTSALLNLSVEGADSLDGLWEELHKRRNEFKPGARVYWKRADHLRVLPAPKGNAWEWRLWRARKN